MKVFQSPIPFLLLLDFCLISEEIVVILVTGYVVRDRLCGFASSR